MTHINYLSQKSELRLVLLVIEIMGYRPDKEKGHRPQYEKNKQRIYATQTICGICGRPVDFSLKYPHPLSPTIDHIIPVSKGGHPSDIDNLQLAHRCCNRQKSDKLVERKVEDRQATLSPRVLPQTFEWTSKPLRVIGNIHE